jgi:hypothetical protein
MNAQNHAPGGRYGRWLYALAVGLLIFSGLAQLPMMKRYYLADLPGLAFSADFYVTSNLHYLAAALLLGILAWRAGLAVRRAGGSWSWGPRGAWGWTLLGLLILSGAGKVLRNAGVFVSPGMMLALDFGHLGAAMAFMFTGLGVLIRGRRRPAASGQPVA